MYILLVTLIIMHEIKIINISAYDPFNPYPAKVENIMSS